MAAGFMCHTGMWTPQVESTGVLPLPTDADQPDGGHCTLWCGYDVPRQLILFKNSWSAKWGEQGYGWMPFEFIKRRLASDMWALVKEK